MRQKSEYVAVILVSANSDNQDVIRGLDAGADDYICKPYDPRVLMARARAQLRIKDLNDELFRANQKLQNLVDIDDLTGLFNMRSIYQRLDGALDEGRRQGSSVCVIMMDMDYFKRVNDDHDHLFGSFVLSKVGELVKESIRRSDFAARYGGDEFLVVLTNVNLSIATMIAERLREHIQNFTFVSGPDSIRLTSSLGFAISKPGDNRVDAKTLVRIADRALYKAKEAGRNQVVATDLSTTPLEPFIHKVSRKKLEV
jgi:diguanylate cyclase (GGDEF)-like protein